MDSRIRLTFKSEKQSTVHIRKGGWGSSGKLTRQPSSGQGENVPDGEEGINVPETWDKDIRGSDGRTPGHRAYTQVRGGECEAGAVQGIGKPQG